MRAVQQTGKPTTPIRIPSGSCRDPRNYHLGSDVAAIRFGFPIYIYICRVHRSHTLDMGRRDVIVVGAAERERDDDPGERTRNLTRRRYDNRAQCTHTHTHTTLRR